MVKVEKVHFSFAFMLFGIQFQPLCNSLGQGHLMTSANCLSTSSEEFPSETTGQISFKFHMQPPGKEGRKVYVWSRSHDQDGHYM